MITWVSQGIEVTDHVGLERCDQITSCPQADHQHSGLTPSEAERAFQLELKSSVRSGDLGELRFDPLEVFVRRVTQELKGEMHVGRSLPANQARVADVAPHVALETKGRFLGVADHGYTDEGAQRA
jgi:hypothetical protein